MTDEEMKIRGNMFAIYREDMEKLWELSEDERTRILNAMVSWFMGDASAAYCNISTLEKCFVCCLNEKIMAMAKRFETNTKNGKKGGRPKNQPKPNQNPSVLTGETQPKPIGFAEKNLNKLKPKLEPKLEPELEHEEEKSSSYEDEKEKPSKPRFVKPSLDECKAYAQQANLQMNVDCFFDHFESNGWKVGGKAAMKDWKAAMRNWARNDFRNSQNSKPRSRADEHPIGYIYQQEGYEANWNNDDDDENP
jgi:hypothetical protein